MTVVVLLLLSKPDSGSLKSAEVVSGDWRLKLLRWQHSWLVVVSSLEVLWSLDLNEESLWSSVPQSWSWHGRKVISLLGIEISYGMEILPWCSLLGPMRMLLVDVWRSLMGKVSLDTLLLRLLVLEELGSLG